MSKVFSMKSFGLIGLRQKPLLFLDYKNASGQKWLPLSLITGKTKQQPKKKRGGKYMFYRYFVFFGFGGFLILNVFF